jgi:Zn-dependent peptidase ImmA (M78 family)
MIASRGIIQPVLLAERVLDELGIDNPGDLEHLDLIAWERGALIQERHLDGAEARVTVAGRRAVITVSTAIKDIRRKRFSIAHELGHFEIHRRSILLALCLSDDLNDWGEQQLSTNREREANEFAAALLLPERFFSPLCLNPEPSIDYLTELADCFNVSLTATALRYVQFCDEPVAVVFSQDNRIKWFQGSKDFKELGEELGVFVDVRSRLDPSSGAVKFFQGHPIPVGWRRVDASAWFRPGRYRTNATIQEQSIAMPSYNAVLTVLWVDDDIEPKQGFMWH